MASRFRSYVFQGTASALFACATPAVADPVDEPADLPQWMVRAQQRLALRPAQQRELRLLVDENSMKLQALSQRPRREQMDELQREFRVELARILEPDQLAEWNALLEELLGAVQLRDPAMLADRSH